MKWRFIEDAAAGGPENMARDELCLAHALETGRPTLRLYGWDRPVLSVGRNQKLERQIDLAACRDEGIPLLRRMTGGRGVLHGTDITYAVAAPTQGGRFSPGIMAIYGEISRVLVRFFQDLGRSPRVKTYSGGERGQMASAVCFATPSAFEILIDGKKVVGSAQRLHPRAFLQHGSIPLHPQQDILCRIFKGVTAGEIESQMTDLQSLGLLESHDREALLARLASAFEEELGVTLEHEPWSGQELERTRALRPAYEYLEQETAPEAVAAGR
ncbi:MAG: lipoate--protein ligase family protein [SAR324 cluster bacterium]|nr:lipoate--protein ligase family protein [SAR324 cluster bacterium]MCZ6644786.1 lipoate--protein ligase family protein [SAR324 cluster bacterium]